MIQPKVTKSTSTVSSEEEVNLYRISNSGDYPTGDLTVNSFLGFGHIGGWWSLHQGWMFTATQRRANAVASVNPVLLDVSKLNVGELEPIESHRILDLIYNPADGLSFFEFMYLIEESLVVEGYAPVLKTRDGNNRIRKLTFIPPSKATPEEDGDQQIVAWNLSYPRKMRVTPRDIINIRRPDSSRPQFGEGIYEKIAVDAKLEVESARSNTSNIHNNSYTSIFKTPHAMTGKQKEELGQNIQKKHSGALNTGKPMILSDGLEPVQAPTPKEMNFLETRKFQKENILSYLGTPPTLFTTEGGNRAKDDAAIATFMRDTIVPELSLIFNQIQKDLVSEINENLFLTYKNPIPSDEERKYRALRLLADRDAISNEELREKLNIDNQDIQVFKNLSEKELDRVRGYMQRLSEKKRATMSIVQNSLQKNTVEPQEVCLDEDNEV